MQSYKFLLRTCQNLAKGSEIVFSSILPRLIDYDTSKEACLAINNRLEAFCNTNNLVFVRSFRRFLRNGKPIASLYAKRDGGLHLSYEGTKQLRQCIINTITHL